ncbi:TetR/AcrR family transcriptional regulator [Mycolicibacterium sp. CBMA 234]|uniref:TetR/AcrR family transcriptional regulator n=1 Tax=Mycolicibacterium sp. CBMA 234 TaxID=1918495 RepID=UPI0012DE9FF2|nr:TetR/AcrR family transcriptional regulator [Mycolicibacterium sp. CBMA 234]
MPKRTSTSGGRGSDPADGQAAHARDVGHDGPRPRGRPRTEIDTDAIADAVARLFVQGGLDAVSIVGAARELEVSRATLYRAVPTRQHLLGILFERSTRELTELASEAMQTDAPVEERMRRMLELQVDAAVRMRHHLSVFYGGGDLPIDVVDRWHSWSRQYEALWMRCVEEAMEAGVLAPSNVMVATRLILGMCIWVSRWYRPSDGVDAAHIAEAAIALLFPRSA